MAAGGHRLRSHPDHSLGFVAFVVDRLLLRSTPVGGTLGNKFRKIRFRFLFAGQGTFLPASGAL
jgi:hypothetical protein